MDALRLLLVEDDADSAESLKLLLEYSGYHVQWVRSGDDAMMALRSLANLGRPRPEVALIDLMLPDMGGVQLARQIRESWPECAVVLHSAAPEYLLKRSAHECGAFGALRKPADLAHLEAMLQNAAVSVAERRLA